MNIASELKVLSTGSSSDVEDWINLIQAAVQLRDWNGAVHGLRQCLQEEGKRLAQQPIAQDQILALALQILEAGDFSTRWHMAKLLPQFGTVAIAPLIAILEDEDLDLEERWFAGRLLGEFRSADIIPVLAEVFQSAEDPDLAAIVAQALASQGVAAIDPLADLLQNPDCCLLAVQALAQIPDATVVSPLLSVTPHPNPEVRATAILALSNFRDQRLDSVLKTAAQDPVTTVRRAAAIGIGRRATPTTVDFLPVLSCLLRDFQLVVCEQAAISLGRLGTESAAAVLALELKSPLTPLPLQKVVIHALTWMEQSFALTHLQQALPKLPLAVQLETVQALGRLSDETLRPQAAEILLAFAATLLGTREAEPTLLQALAHTWKLLADHRAIPVLQQLRAYPDPQVALHAQAALEALA